MMKKLLFIISLLLIGSNIIAQKLPYSLSVNGGMNVSDMDVKYVDTKAKIGYKFNVLFEYNLPQNFFLQTGLEFSNKGAKIKHSEEGDINMDGYYDYMAMEGKYNTMYLSVPLAIGYYLPLPNRFRLNVTLGPYFGYGIGGKTKTKMAMISSSEGYGYGSEYPGYGEIDYTPIVTVSSYNTKSFSSNMLRRFDMGIAAAVGIEYQRILLRTGYEYSFINQLHGDGDATSYNTNFFATLGYRIF